MAARYVLDNTYNIAPVGITGGYYYIPPPPPLPQNHAQTRSQNLAEALQAQQFYSDAQEAESWMKEKELTVGSGDYGKDEDSAQVRQRTV